MTPRLNCAPALPLLGGEAIPPHRLDVILGDTLAVGVHDPEIELRNWRSPCSAARRYHHTASTSSSGTPWPLAYMNPRFELRNWRSPCSAARRYHRTASTSSSGTPSPLAYMTPRLNCAPALPCSA